VTPTIALRSPKPHKRLDMPRSFLFHSIATRRRFGFTGLSSDRRLVESSVALSDMPVMLPARPGQTLHQPGGHRIAGAEGHDRGDTHRPGSERQRKAEDDQRFKLVRLHLLKQLRHALHISLRAASVESEILPERVTALRQHTDKDRAKRGLVVKRIPGTKGAEAIGPALSAPTPRAARETEDAAAPPRSVMNSRRCM